MIKLLMTARLTAEAHGIINMPLANIEPRGKLLLFNSRRLYEAIHATRKILLNITSIKRCHPGKCSQNLCPIPDLLCIIIRKQHAKAQIHSFWGH